MKVTEFFLKRPTLFWSFLGILLVAGVVSFKAMPKLEDPAVAVKQAMVVVPYPGANAHEVELKVVQVMEDKLRTLPNIYKIRSECHAGMAMISIEFDLTVPIVKIEQYFDQLRRKVNDVKIYLPQDCGEPVVIDDMMDVYGIFYSISGDGYDYHELNKYAELIQRELLTVKGVKRINLVGNRSEAINITLSKEKIARNGMVPNQIMMSLQSATSTVGGGKYQSGTDNLQVRVDAEVKTIEDLQNLLLKTTDGKQIRLGDFAAIERTYSEPQTQGFFVNGKPSIAIMVAMENDVVVPDVGKAVDAKLADVINNLPAGITTDKVFFQPDKVDQAISSFMWNLVMSVVVVIIVLIFAMGFRSGMIIGTGLVLTIAASLPILLTLGTTLQRISLGAFIIAMGMLVDNAIVIMDGIIVDRKKGYGPKKYLHNIGKNNALPLLGATIIAVSTFISVFLANGSAAEYSSDLFLVLCVSLLISWVLALVQVPFFAKVFYPARLTKKDKAKIKDGDLMNGKIHQIVRQLMTIFINYKKTTIALAFIVLMISLYGMTYVKNLFFPDFDYKQFIVEYHMPSQTDPDKVRDDLLEMSKLLLENPAIEKVSASQGGAPGMYCLVRPMTNGGESYGELIVDCPDYETVCEQIPFVRKQLREQYPDAYIRIRKYNFSIATSHTVEVEFAGPDPAILRDLSRQAEDIMRACPLVDPYSVSNNWEPQEKTLLAVYNQQDALRAGISRGDIGNALQAANEGMTVGVINDADQMVLVNLRVRNEDGSRIENIRDIPVWTMMNVSISEDDLAGIMTGGKSVSELKDRMFRATPLSNVTNDVALQWDDNLVRRVNGQRIIEAECDPNYDLWEATPAKVLANIQDEINAIELPHGYSMHWTGEIEMQKDASASTLEWMPLTLAIILIVLLILFNSWRQVILILIIIPFVFVGITPTLLLSKSPFTFMAIIGMMGLMGMMVKNAIVLVNEINRLQVEEKVHPYYAVINATISRVTPVLMASLTTIVGMVPLLGDPMYSSMALTIMGGLAVGTVITLLLLPLLYTAFYRIRKPIN
ncbi:efflux RND transporter permease subunit [Draconibacterium mangrovi]|uniref:efflux RND transporter permease subunit n=1 Tax=Draconibacterium mangrovi TaxID=2697469 RepID=UPI0013CFC1D9|nr:efflux RND transporter permease subunit [Draconibacterium mangrovi]